MKELSKIKAFIETLEIKELNSEQESILLLGEAYGTGNRDYITENGICGNTSNSNCKNTSNCENTVNSYNCANPSYCVGSNNSSACTGGTGGTGGGTGASRMAMMGFPGLPF